MAYKPRTRGSWVRVTNGEILRVMIKDRKLSYNQIGNMVDCHGSMISQLVNGHRSTCTEELATRIARALQVPREVLFVDNESSISSRNDKRVAKSKKAAA